MKIQRNLFKWLGIAFFFVTFISFTFLLPPAFAQEENPETETPTPSETPSIPEATPEPLEIPEIESESSFQSFSLQTTTELDGDWAAQVNVSDTVSESFKPQIAADGLGNLHIVWRETVNGNQEIFYTWIDVDKTTHRKSRTKVLPDMKKVRKPYHQQTRSHSTFLMQKHQANIQRRY